ncbi:hypothetical protein [Salinicoccus halodurans]|uniref:Uncharacterized protein n=1 Tax=Salinicoccus halodurans TaxID=407035 RepID=A0A0F7HN05_9STAP|nr:hypothetical protein [Salinicoccus halodurans]AKG74419.1 hypothetical protein AAT16_09420 [Salinicoccus halodurans]SFK95801.1 hypothetical protein SAMN05216235_2781 [Salinicoccus halodurans]
METSLIISIFSAVIALVSVLLSGFSLYINTADRRLKDNPFFIFNSTTFESKFQNDIFVNSILYNFITASTDEEQLSVIREKSVHDFRRKMNIANEKTYLKLYNAGGIGKKLTVKTSFKVPVNQLEQKKTYKHGYWDVLFEEEKNKPGQYSLTTSHRKNGSMFRMDFNSEETFKTPYKGITSDGYLDVSIPKEFILFSNLHFAEIVDELPKLEISIQGKNVYNKDFNDTILLVIDRYKISDGTKGRFLKIGIRGINKE